MVWLPILEKCIWFGFAALGFASLFNVPVRTLMIIWALGAVGGLVKVSMVHLGANVVIASLCGASLIGFLSIIAAHSKHSPHLVFCIPAVIPMVPGVFAYKMMIGLIHLTGSIDQACYPQILSETVNNALKTFFILLSLSVGVAIPMLVTRKSSSKLITLKRK